MHERREREHEQKSEAKEEIRAGEEHEHRAAYRSLRAQPRLSRQFADVGQHWQPRKRAAKVCTGARRDDAGHSLRELVHRQAATDVVLAQRCGGTFAITIGGEHCAIVAPM